MADKRATEEKRGTAEPAAVPAQSDENKDERTRDGKPLFMNVAVTNHTLQINKDEKFIQFAVATETNHKSFKEQNTVVFRRFKEFVWLRAHLEYHSKKLKLPQLPAKSLLSKLEDEDFLERRRAGLDKFVKAVVEEEDLWDDKSLIPFLAEKDLQKAVGYTI